MLAVANSVTSMVTEFRLRVCISHTPHPTRDWLDYKSVMNPEFSFIEQCKNIEAIQKSKLLGISSWILILDQIKLWVFVFHCQKEREDI